MSNTEKLIKKLNENKELRKLKEQQTNKNDTVVRVQQIKQALITLATDLLVNKKIKASLLGVNKARCGSWSKTFLCISFFSS